MLITIDINGKVHKMARFSFFVIITWLSFLVGIRWSVCISKSQRILFTQTDSGLYIYHLVGESNFSFLYNSQWITFPTQSCLVLYFFLTSYLHSLISWVMISSFSSLNLYLLFCRILSILALIELVLMALFWADIRRNSVSLISFPSLLVWYFTCLSLEISIVVFLPISVS